MTTAVIEVGPVTVRGPGPVSTERAGVAVAGVDDPVVLVGDDPVVVADLWAETLADAAAGADRVILVLPSWWTGDRIARIGSAAGPEAVLTTRVQAARAAAGSAGAVVVEIADELVLVAPAEDSEPVVLARHGESVTVESVLGPVMAAAGAFGEVIVDAPAEVAGAQALSAALIVAARHRGVPATPVDRQAWGPALTGPDVGDAGHRRTRAWPRRWAITAAATVAAVLGTVAISGGAPSSPELTVVVEGRIGMQIPVGWTVHRITDGPGSARIQVVSPSDPRAMIHLTQSGLAEGTVADTLRRALAQQPEGVFVDFDPAAVIAARSVASYRELRPGREIRWAVFADGPVRIAVGCQSAPGQQEAMRPACEAAMRSAQLL